MPPATPASSSAEGSKGPLSLALREAGKRVPEDVSVIGVDDSMVGVIPRLELSSYRFDDEQVGAVAFDMAINPPDGKKPPHILVRGVLVERSTVAPPR